MCAAYFAANSAFYVSASCSLHQVHRELLQHRAILLQTALSRPGVIQRYRMIEGRIDEVRAQQQERNDYKHQHGHRLTHTDSTNDVHRRRPA